MPHLLQEFVQFPDKHIYVSCFRDLDSSVLSDVKTKLVEADPVYDYCFLNTQHIISLEHLLSAIHKALVNSRNKDMRARTLNTEIIFNLSPINNIMDALKRFGVSTDCPNLIVIKIIENKEELKGLDEKLQKLLHATEEQNIELSDKVIFNDFIDLKKFKKIYKLNDASISVNDSEQGHFTRLAIGACQLRGY